MNARESGPKGTCFVIMGFGKKTDFETGRTLDLDKSYRHIIKPAVEAAGLECLRADEIVHSGNVDAPMYERLLKADVVVADLSASHRTTFYELGVRHALRPRTTIIICEDGVTTFPFDVSGVLVMRYHHMGEGIDFGEVERFRRVLTETISESLGESPPPKDSPVYTFLEDLAPPEVGDAPEGIAAAAAEPAAAAASDSTTYSDLMEQVSEAQKRGDFETAKALLSTVRAQMQSADPNRPEDPYIIQQLALATYKSRQPTPERALTEARGILAPLDPATSNDPETLGLWGAIHKRLWDSAGEPEQINEAVRAYERGFYLRNDYYNGINLAYLLNARAANAASRAEAVADFVQAERVRREVIEICDAALAEGGLANDVKYWVLATMAEAYLGTGDEAGARRRLEEAYSLADADWMRESTAEQMENLRALLAKSPLVYVEEDAA